MELTINEALKKGIDAHKAGDLDVAEKCYTGILDIDPKHAHANHNKGLLAISLGKVEESIGFFKIALEANSGVAQFWLSYMDALMQLNRISEAKSTLNNARIRGAKGENFDRIERKLGSNENLSINHGYNEKRNYKSNILDELKLDEAILMAKRKSIAGELQKSVSIYKDVLDRYPKNTRAIKGLKRALNKLNHNSPTVQNPPQEQFQSLVRLYNKGKLNEVLKNASLLLNKFPNSYAIYNIMGVAHSDSNRVDLAIELYKKALEIFPNYAEVHLNIGSSFKKKGDLDMALDSYEQALKIKPDYAEAYYNMGNVFKSKSEQIIVNLDGRNDQVNMAIGCYRKALEIRSDYAQAYLNMGNVLKEKGDLELAIDSYKRALTIKPDYPDVYNNMALALNQQDDFEGAIESFQKALRLKPDFGAVYQSIGLVLSSKKFDKPYPMLEKILTSMLDQKDCVRPRAIASSISSLLKFEPAIIKLFKNYSLGTLAKSIDEVILGLSKLPLLLKFMSICPLPDLEFEAALTDLRSILLFSEIDNSKSSPFLRLQSALALQCFVNEYVYIKSSEEMEAIERLKLSIEKSFSNDEQPSQQMILCLASYEPLHHFGWAKSLKVIEGIEEVVLRQIVEPNEEVKLKKKIPLLSDIKDSVSLKVRGQYEINPYPRWMNLGLPHDSLSIAEVFNESKLRLAKDTVTNISRPHILIAGCGTGQHSIETAARFRNSKVLAVDLSMASLAYAKRKTQEHGLNNIEYIQADILSLGKFKEKFDIVESVGVLHHMAEPMAGWKMITSCLKPGGCIKIGLYSELARQNLADIREEIKQAKIGSSEDEMKNFRQEVLKSSKKHYQQLSSYSDFYSLSELRDLLFHIQEHRFSLPQIKICISNLGLEFCGFESPDLLKSFQLENSAPNDLYDLDKWNYYEESHPGAFRKMYQFWCQKL